MSISVDKYSFRKDIYVTLNVRKSWVQQPFNKKLLPRNIEDIYVGIMCICHKYIYYCLFRSNIQHSMLAFHKESTSLLKKKHQRILPPTMLASLVIHNFFSLMYIWMKQPTWNVGSTIYIWSNIIFDKNVI